MLGDCSQGTIAAGQCSQTLMVQRVQMMTEAPQIQFSDVCTQEHEPTKEESPQPVSNVGRAPEVQNHRRDDQAVVRASDSERDRVEPYMSEAWTGEAPTELVGSSVRSSGQTSCTR